MVYSGVDDLCQRISKKRFTATAYHRHNHQRSVTGLTSESNRQAGASGKNVTFFISDAIDEKDLASIGSMNAFFKDDAKGYKSMGRLQ